ncbi:MAG: flagellar brake protein [Deltaproteobacteria bacterium]|jgi:c-di-GMP-binding flagellar brake protein YcgR|nr:flagellar brake protein [Deltaproteobacteria bacterium]
MSEGSINLTSETLLSGQSLRLLAMETIKSKWSTVLIGSKPNRYILVEVPRVNGLPVVLDERSKWSVTFINRGQIVSFPSEILSTVSRPYALAFLSWPETISISNLRVDKRYPVNIPVTVSAADDGGGGGIIAKGLLLDLSWGGCLAASTVELPDETKLRMNMYLDNDNAIEGILIEKKGGRSQQGTYYTGLSFLSGNPSEVTDRLGEFLNDIEQMPLRL